MLYGIMMAFLSQVWLIRRTSFGASRLLGVTAPNKKHNKRPRASRRPERKKVLILHSPTENRRSAWPYFTGGGVKRIIFEGSNNRVVYQAAGTAFKLSETRAKTNGSRVKPFGSCLLARRCWFTPIHSPFSHRTSRKTSRFSCQACPILEKLYALKKV